MVLASIDTLQLVVDGGDAVPIAHTVTETGVHVDLEFSQAQIAALTGEEHFWGSEAKMDDNHVVPLGKGKFLIEKQVGHE